jgi:hypothetical protein
MKCFQCIKEERHGKRKWSEVEDAVTTISGQTYCYEHLKQEIGWVDEKEQRKKGE